MLYCQVIGTQKEIHLNVHPSISLMKAKQKILLSVGVDHSCAN